MADTFTVWQVVQQIVLDAAARAQSKKPVGAKLDGFSGFDSGPRFSGISNAPAIC